MCLPLGRYSACPLFDPPNSKPRRSHPPRLRGRGYPIDPTIYHSNKIYKQTGFLCIMAKKDDKNESGISVKKMDDVSEWYTQVLQKADLIDYTPISGCYVLKPYLYEMWESVQSFFDKEIKKRGVKNCAFPLFIPESLLKKEAQHVQGFKAEVAWVTHGGDSELAERLAIRPTSETIMCDSFARWVRSYRDLPLKINQWCSVVRWEFKHPTPLLRSREFHWQEGHTLHPSKKSAEDEVIDILHLYKQLFEEVLAIPVIAGTKTDAEKFAGAEYTLSVETFLPIGKISQGATSHYLGTYFTKAFDIKFLNEKGDNEFAHHNSWGLSTRSLGVMITMHGDDKGLVLPPKVAPLHAVIVPIIFDDTKDKVLKYCDRVNRELSDFKTYLDDRDCYTAGWKFNQWEMKGVPIRIEIGPKDVEKEQVVMVRRDTGEKFFIKSKDVKKEVESLLAKIQKDLLEKARKHLETSIVELKSLQDMKKIVTDRKLARVVWCGKKSCEEEIVASCEGVKSMCIPFEQPKKLPEKCQVCQGKAKHMSYFGRSY